VPPLSPISAAADAGHIGFDGLIPEVEQLRIPMKYLANMFTAGDERPVIKALKKMLAMRVYRRRLTVDGVKDTQVLDDVGLSEIQMDDMYKTMAIANYEDRFVIPTAHRELSSDDPQGERGGCGFSFGDGCNTDGVTRPNLFGADNPRKRQFPNQKDVAERTRKMS